MVQDAFSALSVLRLLVAPIPGRNQLASNASAPESAEQNPAAQQAFAIIAQCRIIFPGNGQSQMSLLQLLDRYRCLYRIAWRFRFRLLEIRFPAPHADVAVIKFFATNLALAHIATPAMQRLRHDYITVFDLFRHVISGVFFLSVEPNPDNTRLIQHKFAYGLTSQQSRNLRPVFSVCIPSRRA
jgi:hypothetical protein